MKHVVRWLALALTLAPAAAREARANPTLGAFDPSFSFGFEAIHAIHLPTGKILMWGYTMGDGTTQTYVWDPITDTKVSTVASQSQFCAGHAGMADGRILVVGGVGKNILASTFDPQTLTWAPIKPMNHGRFYPTLTTLPDGKMFVYGGAAGYAGTPEVYDPTTNTWTDQARAPMSPKTYPRNILLPDGRIAATGVGVVPSLPTIFDLVTQTWTVLSSLPPRVGGATVAYLPGKVMQSGTDPNPAAANQVTRVFDYTGPTPTYHEAARMAIPRSKNNLTMLPDGTVLSTGGRGLKSAGVYTAELWDPNTETWQTLATQVNPIRREYHATAVLLQDGRVLSAGGEPLQKTAEIYNPPYLYKGPRPTISSAPGDGAWAGSITVVTPDAGSVAKVSLLRLGAVTHAFDENQSFQWLTFTPGVGQIQVDMPANGTLAPPGYYMLFILDGNGVPSIGHYIRLHA